MNDTMDGFSRFCFLLGYARCWGMRGMLLLGLLLPMQVWAGAYTTELTPNTAILDEACVTVNVDVKSSFLISKLTVGLNISHTYRSDMVISLTSPKGTQVTLFDSAGDDGVNLDVLLNDSATKSIPAMGSATHDLGLAYYENQFNLGSGSSLSTFNGEQAVGNWTLKVCDNAYGDDGFVHRVMLQFTGVGNGTYDFGDAPASYGSARHAMTSGLYLGDNMPDAEVSAQSSYNASGDDVDEDGPPSRNPSTYMPSFPILQMTDISYALPVRVTNTTGKTAKLFGWIDYDKNGLFDADEGVSVDVPTGSSKAMATLSWPFIPVDIKLGTTFVRLRLSTDASLTTAQATGNAADGEVEDFRLAIAMDIPPNSPSLSIVNGSTPKTCQATVFVDNFDDVAAWPPLYWGVNRPGSYAIRNWSRSGGGGDTYAKTIDWGLGKGTSIYFGNGHVRQISPALTSGFSFDANGKLLTEIDSIALRDAADDLDFRAAEYNQDSEGHWGPNPVTLYRAFTTVPGKSYQLYFSALRETGNFTPGIMRLDAPGGSIHFKAPGTADTINSYAVEFTATGTTSTISFVNYGHIGTSNDGWCDPESINGGHWCTVGGMASSSSISNELSIDDVKLVQSACTTGTLSGTLYLDDNFNGSYDAASEAVLPSITVRVYDEKGTPADTSDDRLVWTTSTNASGQYSFAQADTTVAYRVEVDAGDTDLPAGAKISTGNPRSGLTVIANGITVVNFGFSTSNYTNNYCVVSSDGTSGLLNLGNMPTAVTSGAGPFNYTNRVLPGYGTVNVRVAMTSGIHQAGTTAMDTGSRQQSWLNQALPTSAGSAIYLAPAANATATLTFDFNQPTGNVDLLLLDVDESDVVSITAKDGSGNTISDFSGWRYAAGDMSTWQNPAPVAAAPVWSAASATVTSTDTGSDHRSFGLLTPNTWVTQIVVNFRAAAASNRHIYATLFTKTIGRDGQLSCARDYGDAPASYGDAVHDILAGLRLGTIAPDAESGSQYSFNAMGDGIEEDGAPHPVSPDGPATAARFPVLKSTDTSYSLPVTVTNTTGKSAGLRGWIDFDKNGTFDADEAASVNVPSGSTSVTLTWTSIPAGTQVGTSFVRLRLTSDFSITNSKAAGAATDGEVEDYSIAIYQSVPVDSSSLKIISGATPLVCQVKVFEDNFNDLSNMGWGVYASGSQSIRNWASAGGGPDTYAAVLEQGSPQMSAIYFGNGSLRGVSPTFPTGLTFDSNGHLTSTINAVALRDVADDFNVQPDASHWGPQPVTLSRSFATTPGKAYRLYFKAMPEDPLTGGYDSGVMRVDAPGGSLHFKVPGSNEGTQRYGIEFIATATTSSITFVNYGHIASGACDPQVNGFCTEGGRTNGTELNELIIDDVVVAEADCSNACPVGQLASSQFGNASATLTAGTVSYTAKSVGAISLDGGVASSSNAALLGVSGSLRLDLGNLIPSGNSLVVSVAPNNATGVMRIETSVDGTAFTSLGTFGVGGTLGTSSLNTLKRLSLAVPASGIRYVRFVQAGGQVWVDGAEYSRICSVPNKDYGDAPASFGGGSQAISSTLYIGSAIPDAELTTQSYQAANGNEQLNAYGDDSHGQDDDELDGLDGGTYKPFPILLETASTYSLTVPVHNTSGLSARLLAWIDFDSSGTFEADEGTMVSVPSNATSVTLNWANIPGDIHAGTTYLRLRLTSDLSLDASSAAVNAVSYGEVEDYLLGIATNTAKYPQGGLQLYRISSAVNCPTPVFTDNFDDLAKNYWGPNRVSSVPIRNWVATGSGPDTYASVVDNASGKAIYFGSNDVRRMYPEAVFRFDADGVALNPPQAIEIRDTPDDLSPGETTHLTDFGGVPLRLARTFSTTPGRVYHLNFEVLSESKGLGLASGIVGVEVSGANTRSLHMEIPDLATGQYHSLVFTADSNSTTVTFINYGHFESDYGSCTPHLTRGCTIGGKWSAPDYTTELILDNVSVTEGSCGLVTGDIAGKVYVDTNLNNSFDVATETVLPGMGVTLLNHSTGAVMATTVTATDGSYLFQNLSPSLTYRVAVDTADSDLPAGHALGTASPLNALTVTAGQSTANQNFGFDPPATVRVAGKVWFDQNADGLQNDGASSYIKGAAVQLFNPASSVVVATKATDANGGFEFTVADGLQAATAYQFRIATLDNVTPLSRWAIGSLHAGSAPTQDSDASLSGSYWVIGLTSPVGGNEAVDYGFGFVAAATSGCLDLGASGIANSTAPGAHSNAYDFVFGGTTVSGYCAERTDADPLDNDVYQVSAVDRQGLTATQRDKIRRLYSGLSDPNLTFAIAANFAPGKVQQVLDTLMKDMTWYYLYYNENMANLTSDLVDSNSNYTLTERTYLKTLLSKIADRVAGVNGEPQYALQNIFWLWNMTSTARQDIAIPAILAAGSSCAVGGNLSGKVFEDVRYGGGAGRPSTAVGAAGVGGARVELYSSLGAFINSTTTALDGSYSFSVANGSYFVRVVSDTVNSSRSGSDGSELGVQTYRSNGVTAFTNEVGGRKADGNDAGAHDGTATLNTSSFVFSGGTLAGGQAQSVSPVTVSGSVVSGVDFGFNFDTITNTNDGLQGSLRQFILNANRLGGEAALAQSGLAAGVESSIFAIPGVGPHVIVPGSALPAVTGSATRLNGYTQAGAVQGSIGSRTLQVVIRQAGFSSWNGLEIRGANVQVSGLVMSGFNTPLLVSGGSAVGAHLWGNYIGTSADGLSVAAERSYDDGIGIAGGATHAIIGTDGDGVNDANEGNLVSGNGLAGNALKLGDGISIEGVGTSGHVVAGNWIGVNAAGSAALGNANHGIRVAKGATHMTVGVTGNGSVATMRNILSGNVAAGLAVNSADGSVPPHSGYVKVSGNYIGVGSNGSSVVSNQYGVILEDNAHDNILGTDGDGVRDSEEGNVISGNRPNPGILIARNANNNVVAGNIIGSDKSGNGTPVWLGNGMGIVVLNADANRIGTDGNGVSDALERNVVVNSVSSGIYLSDGADDNVVAGNLIGVLANGTTKAGNAYNGIEIWNNALRNRIGTNGDGTSDALEANTVVANGYSGIWLNVQANETVIAGNRIGVLENSAAAGNKFHGVMVNVSSQVRIGSNVDGSNDAAEANQIAYNQRSGVAVWSDLTGSVYANAVQIRLNQIFANGELGIDLNDDSITLNDANDADVGSNALLNFPQLENATVSGSNLTVSGCAPAGASIDLYKSDTSVSGGMAVAGDNRFGHSADYGEGQVYLTTLTEGSSADNSSASCSLAVDADGNQVAGMKAFSFTLPVPAGYASGDRLSATASLVASGTSEFGPTVGGVSGASCPVGQSLVPMVDKTGWSVISASSTFQGDKANVIDDKLDTFWLSDYWGTLPQSLVLDMGQVRSIAGLWFYTKANEPNGKITRYRVEVSTDNASWRAVASGSLATEETVPRLIEFPSEDVRYVRLVTLGTTGGSFVYVAELSPVTCAGTTVAQPVSVASCSSFDVFHTGHDLSTGGILPLKRFDKKWLVSSIPVGTTDTVTALNNVHAWSYSVLSGDTTGYQPGSSQTNWHNGFSNKADWISNGVDGQHIAIGPVDTLFRKDFTLDAADQFLTYLFTDLKFNFFVDNAVWDVVVNGTSLKSLPQYAGILPSSGTADPYTYLGYIENNQAHLSILSSLLVNGKNSIVVHLKSSPEYQGLFVETDMNTACVGVDVSDAPASYGNAVHSLSNTGIHLGVTVPDADTAYLASANADGDDTKGVDDENGVVIPALVKGQSTAITVTTAGAGAYLQGWIDWNGDGDFADAGEQIATNLQDNGVGDTNAASGTLVFNVTVPLSAVTTQTFARFRWSTTQGLNSTAVASDGEVEDYAVQCAVSDKDRSDTPASYGEAIHTLVAGIRLGASVDADALSIASADASGDGADDDGISLPSMVQGQSASITATVMGAGGYLQGWIDWNGDGDFADAGERIATNIQDNGTGDSDASSGKVRLDLTVPATAVTVRTFARFRWSTTTGLDSVTSAADGEVEDYALTVDALPIPPNVGGGSCSATGGTDILFIVDNSGSIDAGEYSDFSKAIQSVGSKLLLTNPHNRVAVVHYGGPTTSLAAGGQSVYIERDFSSSVMVAPVRQFGPGGAYNVAWSADHMAGAIQRLRYALDGNAATTSSYIVSPLKETSRNMSTPLQVILMTDAFRDADNAPSDISMLVDPAGSAAEPDDGSLFTVYNQLKSEGVHFSVVSFNPEPFAIAASAAIASVGGTYAGNVEVNPGDPEGSAIKPRRFISVTAGFQLTTAQQNALVETTALCSNPVAGTIFEDVNYGGSNGRPFGTSGTVGVAGATIEVYDGGGTYIASTVSGADGAYKLPSLPNGSYYVRVVNSTVNSSRSGSNGSEWPVMTFRSNGTTPVTTEVGGMLPYKQDAGANTGASVMNAGLYNFTGGNLSDGYALSVQPVTLSGSALSKVDFGFNFDTVVNANDSGQGSLRQFVANSNLLGGEGLLAQQGRAAGKERSIFMLSKSDPGYRNPDGVASNGDEYWSIPLNSVLQTLAADTALDASTQAGTQCNPSVGRRLVVELDGKQANRAESAILLAGARNEVRGFAMGSTAGDPLYAGILASLTDDVGISSPATNSTISCNNLGVNPLGQVYPVSFVNYAFRSLAKGVVLGGDSESDRNILLQSVSSLGADAVIKNNYIGVSSDGTSKLPMGPYSVLLGGANSRLENNKIVTGSVSGVLSGADGAVVRNNTFGLAANGETLLANDGELLRMEHANALVENNVFAGGGAAGVGAVILKDGATFRNNTIGFTVSGAQPTGVGAANAGISVQSGVSNTPIVIESNRIGNAKGAGISFWGNVDVAVTLTGNWIGVASDGVTAAGNVGEGINLANMSLGTALIGGEGKGNVIAHNGGAGIVYSGTSKATISANSLYDNGGLGIDLNADGVSQNDAGDTDTGPNGMLNYPEVKNSSFGANGSKVLTYDFDLDVPANTHGYRVEFFMSAAADPSGHGEGRTYLGYADISPAGTGTQNFKGLFNANQTVPVAAIISATLTEKLGPALLGGTSEFSGTKTGSTTSVCTDLLSNPDAPLADMQVNENSTTITLLEAIDANGDPVTYVISGGVDGSMFSIQGPQPGATFNCYTLVFKKKSPVVITRALSVDKAAASVLPGNFEYPTDNGQDNNYDVLITAIDSHGNAVTKSLQVTVQDVNEAPSITSAGTVSVAEGLDGVVQTVVGYDPDAADAGKLSYALEGVDAKQFELNSQTGELRFIIRPDFEKPLDANADNHYELKVTVADRAGFTDTQSLQVTVTDVSEMAGLSVRVLLQGPYDSGTGLMGDTLRSKGLLPVLQPYGGAPFNYTGGESINLGMVRVEGADAMVDWALLELRAAANPSHLMASKAVLLQRDGDLMDAATGSTLHYFNALSPGNYFVSVRHRNHLGVMSAMPVALSGAAVHVDFSVPSTAVQGTHARLEANGLALLWAGDVVHDERVLINGVSNDMNPILAGVLSAPENTGFNSSYRLSGYLATDLNMDGASLFMGPGNDANVLLGNVLLYPANTGFAGNYVIQGGLVQ